MRAQTQSGHNGPARLGRALSVQEVDDHRNICCGRYAMCLEVVVRRQWPSFTCRFCSLWESAGPRQRRSRPATVLFLHAARQG